MASRSVSVAPGGAHQVTGDTVVASGSGYPDASNTGVPSGTSLTDYDGSYTPAAGTVIDGQRFSAQPAPLQIGNDNITIRNCLFENDGVYYYIESTGGTNLLVEDCTFIGESDTAECLNINSATVQRCDISGSGDGMKVGSNTTVQDCYIHDMYIGPVDPHADGIQSLGADTVLIEHNTITMPLESTSCVILSTGSGQQFNITVNDNLLTGGIYCIYGGYEPGSDPPEDVDNIVISNNRISTAQYSTGGANGAFTSIGTPNVSVTGNVWHDGPNEGQAVTS